VATKNKKARITLDFPHVNLNPVAQLSYNPGGGVPPVLTYILAANEGYETNTMSVVLLITYRNVDIFLMGDATEATENAILTNWYQPGSWLRQRVQKNQTRRILKVGHHGSATSSSQNWIQSILPELAFVSSDTKGFGRKGTSIPRKEILDRILSDGQIMSLAAWDHYYVDYDSDTEEHQLEGRTPRGMFTSLYRLKWRDHLKFKAYGTSWYLTIYNDGTVGVDPACTWPDVRVADPRP
jgi:hypothetical protein